jgi:hypothetical protein
MVDEKEIVQLKMRNGDNHPDGVTFYDVHGMKYLFNTTTRATSQISSVPDYEMLAGTRNLSARLSDSPKLLMSGNGIFRRLCIVDDAREMHDMEYNGDLMYNIEADSQMHYLIFKNIRYGSMPMDDYSANFRIRGNFKRVAFLASEIKDTKITIISETNPEVFIVGSDVSDSMIEIINNDGVPHSTNKIRRSDETLSDHDMSMLVDYIRSGDSDIIDESEDSGSEIFGAGVAACLAIAGIVAAKSARSKKTYARKVEFSNVARK